MERYIIDPPEYVSQFRLSDTLRDDIQRYYTYKHTYERFLADMFTSKSANDVLKQSIEGFITNYPLRFSQAPGKLILECTEPTETHEVAFRWTIRLPRHTYIPSVVNISLTDTIRSEARRRVIQTQERLWSLEHHLEQLHGEREREEITDEQYSEWVSTMDEQLQNSMAELEDIRVQSEQTLGHYRTIKDISSKRIQTLLQYYYRVQGLCQEAFRDYQTAMNELLAGRRTPELKHTAYILSHILYQPAYSLIRPLNDDDRIGRMYIVRESKQKLEEDYWWIESWDEEVGEVIGRNVLGQHHLFSPNDLREVYGLYYMTKEWSVLFPHDFVEQMAKEDDEEAPAEQTLGSQMENLGGKRRYIKTGDIAYVAESSATLPSQSRTQSKTVQVSSINTTVDKTVQPFYIDLSSLYISDDGSYPSRLVVDSRARRVLPGKAFGERLNPTDRQQKDSPFASLVVIADWRQLLSDDWIAEDTFGHPIPLFVRGKPFASVSHAVEFYRLQDAQSETDEGSLLYQQYQRISDMFLFSESVSHPSPLSALLEQSRGLPCSSRWNTTGERYPPYRFTLADETRIETIYSKVVQMSEVANTLLYTGSSQLIEKHTGSEYPYREHGPLMYVRLMVSENRFELTKNEQSDLKLFTEYMSQITSLESKREPQLLPITNPTEEIIEIEPFVEVDLEEPIVVDEDEVEVEVETDDDESSELSE